MKVLQFGLEGNPDDPFLPHNYIQNCVAYTGTHDNDTSLGWYDSSPVYVRDYARRYLSTTDDRIAWEMVRSIWSSVAEYAIVPLQDLLNLGTDGRMNYPGTLEGNWEWRVEGGQLTSGLASRMRELSQVYGRI
jgi:4-alpha-glucanotransferase